MNYNLIKPIIYIPLYDLVLIKREPRVIRMSESIVPLEPLRPMKPGKKFYDVNMLLGYLFGGGKR